jgi:N-acetyl-anhydromuramyl-L-alanine amidase AmpD
VTQRLGLKPKIRSKLSAILMIVVVATLVSVFNVPFTAAAQAAPNPKRSTDCPRKLACRFIPAAYAANSEDPADYGNWDPANRPRDLKIRYIIIHDTEGSYQSSVDWIQNPISKVSAHYVLKSSDGEVTQMVRLKDVAWGAGNWFMNPHSINIEHEGFAAQGQAWYTEEMYRSSATLVRWLAKKYDIPLDRQHIIGHDDIPRLTRARMIGAHTDPGPFWDWEHYMELLRAPEIDRKPVTKRTKVVAITPRFDTNRPLIRQCVADDCTNLPEQGANIVYLHTEPRADAPLLSNRYMHPDGAPGTNRIEDWSATAVYGHIFALADKQGDWTGVWYDGRIGWFYNPEGNGSTASATHARVVTPKAGKTAVPVYAGAYPEAAAFPATIPVQTLEPLYEMPAGQFYPRIQKEASDYFYDATIDFSLPDDHMIVRGNDKYYRIAFNHRLGYVKTTDVDVKRW